MQNSLSAPDPFRVRYREALNEAMGLVVRDHRTVQEVLAVLQLPKPDTSKFQELLLSELAALAPFNCARYRLGIRDTQNWIDEGRPQ